MSTIESIFVNFNGTVVEMSPIYWVAYDPTQSECTLLIGAGSNSQTILGDSFLRGRYVVHDIAG